MYIDKVDYNYFKHASVHPDLTDSEKYAISYCLAMYAACEHVDQFDYKIAINAVYRLGVTSPPLGYFL